MLFKSFFLLISLGNAAYILEGGQRISAASEDPTEPPQVNGTITSVEVIGGIGCPAGSYHVGPFQPGKSLNTYVEFDAGTYLYNSSATAPVDCTIKVAYEFVHPEGGSALVEFSSINYYDARYEEGDTEKTAEFVTDFQIIATAGDDSIDVSYDSTFLASKMLISYRAASLYKTPKPTLVTIPLQPVCIQMETPVSTILEHFNRLSACPPNLAQENSLYRESNSVLV